MDISKAKKFVELIKGDRKILVTVYEGGLISSCVEEKENKYCETCQCDDEVCQEYIDHLKSQGYGATEIKVGELETAESLPRFLKEREVSAKEHPVVETEENVHADNKADEAVLRSPGELPEPADSSPETS